MFKLSCFSDKKFITNYFLNFSNSGSLSEQGHYTQVLKVSRAIGAESIGISGPRTEDNPEDECLCEIRGSGRDGCSVWLSGGDPGDLAPARGLLHAIHSLPHSPQGYHVGGPPNPQY